MGAAWGLRNDQHCPGSGRLRASVSSRPSSAHGPCDLLRQSWIRDRRVRAAAEGPAATVAGCGHSARAAGRVPGRWGLQSGCSLRLATSGTTGHSLSSGCHPRTPGGHRAETSRGVNQGRQTCKMGHTIPPLARQREPSYLPVHSSTKVDYDVPRDQQRGVCRRLGHWPGPPGPACWCLAPCLFLAKAKLVTRAGGLVGKSVEGCGL